MPERKSHWEIYIALAAIIGVTASIVIHRMSLPAPPWEAPPPSAQLPPPPASYDDAPFLTTTKRLNAYNANAGSPDETRNGNSTSPNHPIRIPGSLQPLPDQLSLLVTDEPGLFDNAYKGVRFYLINTSQARIPVNAEDARLHVIQEALAPDGQWRPIEAWAHSGCGNSSHVVFLPSSRAWQFTAPRYGGSYQTKLRFALSRRDDYEGIELPTIYSNEFDGSINPSQFRPLPEELPSLTTATPQADPLYPNSSDGQLQAIDIPNDLSHMEGFKQTQPGIPQIIVTRQPTYYREQFKGFTAYIVNNSSNTLSIPTADGIPLTRIEIKLGTQWRPLGNPAQPSPTHVQGVFILDPQKAISLAGPTYTSSKSGCFRLTLDTLTLDHQPATLISDDFWGDYHASQLSASPTP